ncbi:hypothetical protein L195_g061219, partial [Trifolium pratense]
HEAYKKLFTHNMEVNIKVFCAFVEDRISSNMECTLVLTIKNRKFGTSDMKIIEQVDKPLELTSCSSKSTVLCFI